jgi:hypothetical protein
MLGGIARERDSGAAGLGAGEHPGRDRRAVISDDANGGTPRETFEGQGAEGDLGEGAELLRGAGGGAF